jgi:NADH dehydrogenase FAD-containing subunit
MANDDRKYPYDILVLATGSRQSPLIKSENVSTTYHLKHMRSEYETLKNSDIIAVIGGGRSRF